MIPAGSPGALPPPPVPGDSPGDIWKEKKSGARRPRLHFFRNTPAGGHRAARAILVLSGESGPVARAAPSQ